MDDRDHRWRAVEQAYRDHADDVYRVAFSILRDADAAVDATHDTFARAFDHWHQYDANRPLRAWLHGIASHAALDMLRRRRVRALAIPALGRVHEATAPAEATGDPAGQIADREQISAAMDHLKPEARAALVLRHYYGYDYAEIARFLRTNPGNVGSILSRAHATLRTQLVRDETEPSTELPAPRRAQR